MPHVLKHCTTSDEYWRAREFLRRLHVVRTRPSGNWHVGDFDYWRWHWLENVVERPLDFHMWESAGGEIVAVLVQGDPGVCHPMADPTVISDSLRHDMLEVAESELSSKSRDGRRFVFIWADETDDCMNGVLATRGYTLHESAHAVQANAWQALPSPPEAAPLPAGYSIRSMGDVDELPARSLASWRSFHPNEADQGANPTGDWYRNIQRAPLYRRDLDIVAIAPNGDVASFATCYFDDVVRTGDFVLVGTAPRHRRKGLGKAVVTEALRRLYDLGAIGAYVSWSESVPGALYQSTGFTDYEIGRAWSRSLGE